LGKNNVDMKKEENAPKEVVRYYWYESFKVKPCPVLYGSDWSPVMKKRYGTGDLLTIIVVLSYDKNINFNLNKNKDHLILCYLCICSTCQF
jgi:hypothetical protein